MDLTANLLQPASSASSSSNGAQQRRVQRYVIAFVALLAIFGILYCFNPDQNGFYPRCAFHSSTGLQCPGCGCLRAAHQLLHGHLLTAFHFNPLFVAVLPFILWQLARGVVRSFRGEPQSYPTARSLWLGGAVLLIFGILRNLPFDCFAWMRP